MSTRTLSPAALRPPAPRRTAQALVVVPDGTATPPAWAERWCGRAGWELRRHPGAGPTAAAAAARLNARVLLLRPAAPSPVVDGRDRGAEQDRPVPSPRVVAAVRGLPEDATVVADAAACAACLAGRLTIVHAVPRSFAGRSVGLDGAVTRGRRLLDTAASRACAHEPGLRVDCQLLRVRPHELVGEALHADLLVVGGPRADRVPGPAAGTAAGPGLVAHSALHHAPCPVLLTPR